MKSFDKFNVEAMVHHIALKEGMSYDERQSLMEALPLAIPAVSLIGKGLATAYGMWSAYNAAKKLMPRQTQQRPAVDYGQGGGSFASSTEKPKAKVTTTGGVSATPDIKPAPPPAGKETKVDPKAKPASAPSIPEPKTDWEGDPSKRDWPRDMTDKPLPPKSPKNILWPSKPTPKRDIASVATGAGIAKLTPPIGKKPAPELGDDDDKKPEKPKPIPQLGGDKKPEEPKPKPRVKTQAEIDREQGRNDADALPPVRPRGTVPPPRITLPKDFKIIRSRTR